MSWDSRWEDVFASRPWGRYPPEELIRFVARRYYGAPDRRAVRILEVGCGPGPVLWYLAREGFDVSGIDGSPTAIEQARHRLADDGLAADLQIGDFSRLEGRYPAGRFDAVVDVTSIQQNRLEGVAATLHGVRAVLRENGRFFGIMLAEGSWGYGTGRQVEPGTFADIAEGPLVGMGVSHFFTEDELHALFCEFVDLEINYSLRTMDNQAHSYKHWLVEARRP